MSVAVKAYEQISPGNALSLSHLCLPHIRPCFPCRYRALNLIAFLPSISASYVISVRQASALLSASFRFDLTVDTLAKSLIVPTTGPIGDFHPLVSAPCRAHNAKRSARLPAFVNFSPLRPSFSLKIHKKPALNLAAGCYEHS